jgi:putative endonuclease
MSYHVYIVRCADATLYTGVATDLVRRVGEHNGETPTGKPSRAKLGARYTAARRPVALVYSLAVETRSQAQREEARLKKLTRAEKLALAQPINPVEILLTKSES